MARCKGFKRVGVVYRRQHPQPFSVVNINGRVTRFFVKEAAQLFQKLHGGELVEA